MDDLKWKADFANIPARSTTPRTRSEARFRNHGFLKYWFREESSPWVRKSISSRATRAEVAQRLPSKLQLVNHTDYIPESSARFQLFPYRDLPPQDTRLSRPVRLFQRRLFIINHLPKERFFRRAAQRHCRLPLQLEWAMGQMFENNIRATTNGSINGRCSNGTTTSGFTVAGKVDRGSPAC